MSTYVHCLSLAVVVFIARVACERFAACTADSGERKMLTGYVIVPYTPAQCMKTQEMNPYK